MRKATLSKSISYIPKLNGLQHFESNKTKYAPKSSQNKVHKEAVLPKYNRRSSHGRNSAYKSNPNKRDSRIKRNTQYGFWLYGSSELCPNSGTCYHSDMSGSYIHVLYIQSAECWRPASRGLQFVVSECVSLCSDHSQSPHIGACIPHRVR